MAKLLKDWLGNSSRDHELSEEMRTVLREIRQERGLCEALVKSARASITRIQELSEPIAKAETDMEAVASRLGGLERRLVSFERLTSQLQNLDETAERLAQYQRQADARIAHAAEDAQRIRSLIEELSHKVDLALDVKERLGTFLELETPFRQMQSDAEQTRRLIDGTHEQLTRIREQHDRVMSAHKDALSKMDGFDRRHEDLARAVQEKERRVTSVEQALRGLNDVQQTVEDTRRGLTTLKALADFVTQKTTALEAQREVVDRAVARADDLDQAMRQIDSGVRQQQANATTLSALQDQVGALQSLHESVLQRSRELDRVQRESDDQVRHIHAELAGARDDVRKSVERFEFESKGLESVSQRVADLRTALADAEARFAGLDESNETVLQLHAQTQVLSTQLESIAEDIGRLDEETRNVEALRRDLDEVTRTAQDAGEQTARIEEARPAVEAALRDFEQLRSTHALVKDALERTQLASVEISRVREEQSDTRSWLHGVQQSLGELGEQVSELRKLAPTVEFVQKQVQRVNESTSAIEARRDFIEDMHRRMAELSAQGATLDERGRELQTRMEAAEQRFVRLGEHADEADRLGKAVSEVTAALQEAEHDAAEIGRNVAALEARCESVDRLAERMRAMRQELEQRQNALEAATKDLHRAAELRQEAAAAAQELDERAKRLATTLSSADRQVSRVDGLSSQLEERAAGLRFVEKRLGQFEERLAKWELVEQDVARSLDQLAARQSTVDALQADVERMFVMAEKTAADVRTITSAHREVEQGRRLLDDVMNQLREVRDSSATLEERRRQMNQAEARLARTEALLIDVRSSLEVLQGQKVIVDHVLEKAGSLQFLLKQAEAMIEGLREERDVTMRVRAAVSAAHEDDPSDGTVHVA
jgi:chromosome segregation ATPase